MSENYLGESVGKLGFGYMRLPRKDGKFDIASVNEMVDEFLSYGFSHFDTSYIYEGSEEALRESLVKRHPRDRFQIATKMTPFRVRKPEHHYEQLETSLERLGVDFVDYYFIHALTEASIKIANELDTWAFMREVREKGYAKHIGFSFHGTPEELDEVLTGHPEFEVVQLQINYLDWESDDVQSRRCYEIARKHGKPVIVMEPTKGGLLAGGESEIVKLFEAADPDASAASWAFRFVGELDGLVTALSGMESIDHIRDNAKTFADFKPLSEEEHQVIRKAVDIINAIPRVPCTSCRYCVPNCPKGINIPMYIDMYNSLLVHKHRSSTGYKYASMTSHGTSPVECVKCRECEKHCPQHIEISDVLTKLTDDMESVRENYVIRTK